MEITPSITHTSHRKSPNIEKYQQRLAAEVSLTGQLFRESSGYIDYIHNIEDFMILLEETGPEVQLLDKPAPMRPMTNLGRLERFFISRIFNVDQVSALTRGVRFSDRVELFLKVREEHQGALQASLAETGQRCRSGRSNVVKEDIARINHVIQQLRQGVKDPAFRKRLLAHRQQASRNLASMQRLVDALYRRYARLLVVRVDLGYLKEVHEENHALRRRDPCRDIEMALEHRKKLINNFRHKLSIFEHLKGYIFQLEQGIQGGCHFHTLFFFDGSKVQSDYFQATLIGDYWRDHITKGQGRYHVTYARPGSKKVMGVGLIDHYDTERRNALSHDALRYLVKDEQLVLVKPSRRIQTLTLSKAPLDICKPGPKRQRIACCF